MAFLTVALGCRPAPLPAGADSRLLVMEIAPSRMACTGVVPQQCLRVRVPPDTAWILFYDSIEGFQYEEGSTWRIEVERVPVTNPPADGSSFRYRLRRVLSRTP